MEIEKLKAYLDLMKEYKVTKLCIGEMEICMEAVELVQHPALKELEEKIKATDEEILFNPYHGMDGEDKK